MLTHYNGIILNIENNLMSSFREIRVIFQRRCSQSLCPFALVHICASIGFISPHCLNSVGSCPFLYLSYIYAGEH